MSWSIGGIFKRLLPLLILAAGVGGFLYLKSTAPVPEAVAPVERAWLVETLAVTPGRHRPTLRLHGQVEAPDLFTAVSPTAARVDALKVRDGDRVNAGDLLLRLDEEDFLPSLRRGQADVDELKALIESENLRHRTDKQALEREQRLLDNAERALERAESLQARNLGSQAQIDEARDAVERATLTLSQREQNIAEHPARLAGLKARLERARADLAVAERDLRRAVVTAPFDGIVSQVLVAAGDQVGSHTPLLRLYPIDGLQLRAKLPGRHAREIVEALRAGETLTARETGNGLSLTLLNISGEGDGRGVDALFAVEQPCEALRLGGMVTLVMQRPAVDHAVALPYSALYGNDRIYRVRDGRLERLRIEQVGEIDRDGDTWMLARGDDLQAGDQIAITHLPNAMEGLKVAIAGEEP